MTLKEQMEIAWNSKGCTCPFHLVRWLLSEDGWMYPVEGTRLNPKGKKAPKGYSFLPKNYSEALKIVR